MLLIIFTTIGLVFRQMDFCPLNSTFCIALTKLQFFCKILGENFVGIEKTNTFAVLYQTIIPKHISDYD